MYILDTCAFLTQKHPKGDIATLAAIESELKNRQSKQYFRNMVNMGLIVQEPNDNSLEHANKNAEITGDLDELSNIDLNILALALELKGTIVTDDFAIQNVAMYMGIPFISCSGFEIKELIKWKYRCPACRSETPKKVDKCSVCGHEKILRFKAK